MYNIRECAMYNVGVRYVQRRGVHSIGGGVVWIGAWRVFGAEQQICQQLRVGAGQLG